MISPKKIAFVSWHNYLDQTNGASISTRALLLALAMRGWQVMTFCGPTFDRFEPSLCQYWDRHADLSQVVHKSFRDRSLDFSLSRFMYGTIRSLTFTPSPWNTRVETSLKSVRTFLGQYRSILEVERPDVVLTYGGFPFKNQLLYTAHEYGAKTCVILQNFGYTDLAFFIPADVTIVPSLFSREEYKGSIGLETVNIPPVIDFEPFRNIADIPQNERQALVFVNPSANKGVYWFVRIAKELWKKRPDIPILVVEGSSGREILANPIFGLEEVGNISFMSNTLNPEDFYKKARVIIVPSFFNESYARVVAEAMAAGVPVVASNRGALPETVGDAGLILDIPRIYQPQTTLLPSAEEVQEWIAAIVKLWNDASFWQTMSAKGRERVERLWNEESVIDRYEEVLTKLILTN